MKTRPVKTGPVKTGMKVVTLAVALAASACGGAAGPLTDPAVLGMSPYGPAHPGQDFHGEKNFATLLNGFTSGKTTPTPWAGFWWPYTQNGIASGHYGSPAGKYDAARGGRTNAQGWEVKNHGKGVPKVQGWWGHCNGWCAASGLFPEPSQPVKVNGITFDISDIKGLLTEAGMEASADFYGERVDWGSDYTSSKYWDVIPNQYFLLLTNYVGKLNQAVLMDRFTGDQIWNQPVAGYRFEYPTAADYLGADPAAPGVYRINLTSTIYWVRDDVVPGVQTTPFDFAENDLFQSRVLKMELWLDGPVTFGADGRVASSGNLVVTRQGDALVGGAWRNGAGFMNDAHPDYMWIPYSILKPTDYANENIDIEWIRAHILSGGVDDPSVTPSPVAPVPSGTPTPWPSWDPTPRPTGHPTPGPTSEPTPRPTHQPFPWPTFGPRPTPRPTPGPTGR